MKNTLTLIAFLITSFLYSQEYVLVEINSEWNLKNSAKIAKVKNVKIKKALLEDQPVSLQKKIKAVPIAILYKDNSAIARWDADISFKLVVTEEQILKAISKNK
tara:strand:+ start:5818 stop:6129 length:312 start_codon:yes stop_codon:yes gene_type:complete